MKHRLPGRHLLLLAVTLAAAVPAEGVAQQRQAAPASPSGAGAAQPPIALSPEAAARCRRILAQSDAIAFAQCVEEEGILAARAAEAAARAEIAANEALTWCICFLMDQRNAGRTIPGPPHP